MERIHGDMCLPSELIHFSVPKVYGPCRTKTVGSSGWLLGSRCHPPFIWENPHRVDYAAHSRLA